MILEYDHLIDSSLIMEVKLSYIEYTKNGYSVEDITSLIFEDFSLDEEDNEYLDLCLSLVFIQIDNRTIDYDLRQKTIALIDVKLEEGPSIDLSDVRQLLVDCNKKFLN